MDPRWAGSLRSEGDKATAVDAEQLHRAYRLLVEIVRELDPYLEPVGRPYLRDRIGLSVEQLSALSESDSEHLVPLLNKKKPSDRPSDSR